MRRNAIGHWPIAKLRALFAPNLEAAPNRRREQVMRLSVPVVLALVTGGALLLFAHAVTRDWGDARATRDVQPEAAGHTASLTHNSSWKPLPLSRVAVFVADVLDEAGVAPGAAGAAN